MTVSAVEIVFFTSKRCRIKASLGGFKFVYSRGKSRLFKVDPIVKTQILES